MIRFDSLKDLHDKLAEIELLKNKIQLCNDEIVINFHKDFVLEIKLKDFFSVYINSILYYNIEEQDIWESIHEIIDEKVVFIESNGLFKRKVVIIDWAKFERKKEKYMKKKQVKIYSTTNYNCTINYDSICFYSGNKCAFKSI